MNAQPIILALVFAGIMFRQFIGKKIRIWHIMAAGAVLSLISYRRNPADIASFIDLDVIVFLIFIFIIGEAVIRAELLERTIARVSGLAKGRFFFFILLSFTLGALAAFFMNDTVAVIGTPFLLVLSERTGISHKLMLLLLAFSITTGSVLSPIGNPQNLMIALSSGMSDPFGSFFARLALPTVISLALIVPVLFIFYPSSFTGNRPAFSGKRSGEPQSRQCFRRTPPDLKASLLILTGAIIFKMTAVAFGVPLDIKLTYIAVLSAIPLIIARKDRLSLIRSIDWETILFFIFMFILTGNAWAEGGVQELIRSGTVISEKNILPVSIILSQFLSNVPLAAFLIPVVRGFGGGELNYLLLASGSTIAGNMLLLGAASNIIIVQNAEKKGYRLGFFEFAAPGLILTFMQFMIYYSMLRK